MSTTRIYDNEGVEVTGSGIIRGGYRVETIYERQWGNWRLFKSGHLQLGKDISRCIDLKTCTDSAGILDWIFHYRGRLSPQDTYDLLEAIDDVLYPCKNYCSWGSSKTQNPKELINSYWKTTDANT